MVCSRSQVEAGAPTETSRVREGRVAANRRGVLRLVVFVMEYATGLLDYMG